MDISLEVIRDANRFHRQDIHGMSGALGNYALAAEIGNEKGFLFAEKILQVFARRHRYAQDLRTMGEKLPEMSLTIIDISNEFWK